MNDDTDPSCRVQVVTQDRPSPLKLVATLVVDYIRWTQLTPMITMWFFGVAMLVAMFFVNNQDLTFNIVGRAVEWISQLPWIGEALTTRLEEMADEDGGISLGGAELEAMALKAWSGLSLIFMALALTIGRFVGPFEPWRLRKKLTSAAIACGFLLLGFIAVYYTNSDTFNGSTLQWMLMFTGVAVLVYIVNAWCLSIAHLLELLNRVILNR